MGWTVRRCLLQPETVERIALPPLCRGRRGIVFPGLRDEDVSLFILNVAAELKEKGIADESGPCTLFAQSFLARPGESGGRDLVLLLKRLSPDTLCRLGRWLEEQDNRTVMLLTDYLTNQDFEDDASR